MLDFSKNYFELFGLPVGYIVDSAELSERYRELQRIVHPDRFANASDQERRLSVQGAALINEAYETLKDPVARGSYLLGLHGLEMDTLNESTQDMDFLMQQMELREELEGVRNQAEPYEAVLDISKRVNRQITSLVGQMAVQFETPTAEQLGRPARSCARCAFCRSCTARRRAFRRSSKRRWSRRESSDTITIRR
jgi:molecular chaperone HscB